MDNAIRVPDIREGDRFWHDGKVYEATGYAQQLAGPWFRIPLNYWQPSDPRAIRLHKSDNVLRHFGDMP